MGEVLGVAGLVEEGVPVVGAADRLDDEHDALGHLDRGAERARALLGPRLQVEVDVLLGAQVDPEPVERPLERGHHAVAGEALVPLARAEDARDVEAPRLLERHAGAAAQERVERGHVEVLGLGEEGAALLGELVEREPEAVVELPVARSAEGARALAPLLVQGGPARGQLLLRERDAGRVELLALAAVGLVRDRGAEHPVRNVLAVDARRERRLEPGDLLRLGPRQVAEIALAGEAPELGLAVASCAGRLGQPGRGLERRQIGEALVDRLELEALLQARIVEVVLLVEGGDEPVRLVPVCVEASREGPSPWVA